MKTLLSGLFGLFLVLLIGGAAFWVISAVLGVTIGVVGGLLGAILGIAFKLITNPVFLVVVILILAYKLNKRTA